MWVKPTASPNRGLKPWLCHIHSRNRALEVALPARQLRVKKLNRPPPARPCVRVNRPGLCAWMNRQSRGMKRLEKSGVVERKWRVFLLPHVSEEESLLVEWARGQGLTVQPHPPLLSNNFPQLLNKTLNRLDETREDGKLNKVVTHGFHPHRPRFDIPPPLSFGIMPFSFSRCTAIAGCGFILFDVRFYMMPNL